MDSISGKTGTFSPVHPLFSDSLGILTKSASMPDFKGVRENAIRRAEKYSLQDTAVKLLPNERVRFCLKHRIDAAEPVTVRYNERTTKAHYSNVQRCGSVWVCPVCAAQISEGRGSELRQGINQFLTSKGAVYLLTLTNSHHFGDSLSDLLDGQRKALKYFWSDRKPKEHFQSLDKIGHIIATEVTHGKNGWHPHFHILLFFARKIDIEKLQAFLAVYWIHCCKKAKLKLPSLENGCDLKDGKHADQYIAKWGLEHEMTKGHIKKGRQGSNTPFDLLRLAEDGCKDSAILFKQFAAAFKGKRQLFWSRGLKDLLLIKEVTDETLATETEKDSVEVKKLAYKIWQLIKLYKVRADFLRCIELDMLDDANRANDLIMSLAEKYVIEYKHELMKDDNLLLSVYTQAPPAIA